MAFDFFKVFNLISGGEGGIRTPETREGLPVFKTGAINRSATSPFIKFLSQINFLYKKESTKMPVYLEKFKLDGKKTILKALRRIGCHHIKSQQKSKSY